MARRPLLSAGTLNPFGGTGASFDAFNVAASMGEQAYLLFRKKEIEWEAGRISDDEYLSALQAYGAALPEGSEKLNAQNRYDDTRSRLTRNRLIGDIEGGTKEWDELLTYDLAELAKVTNQNSQTYDERISNVRQVQTRIFSEQEDVQRERYSDGLLTAAQLQAWYQDKLGGDLTDNNPELGEEIGKRVDEIRDVVLQERDSKMVGDFNAGKVGYSAFVAYGNAARGRYAKGTPQHDDWTERLSDAKDSAIEQSITYRYGLSQRYEDLARFIRDHGTAPKGHTTTSTSGGRKGTTRVVWNGSAWVTVRVGATSGGTKTTYHGPSPSEVKAWKELQLEVTQAKKEMSRIQGQLGRQPGGFVSTTDMTRYYTKIQSKYAKGSPEWYQVQERLDGLAQQAAKEKVFAQKGLKVSYPRVSTERNEFGTQNSQGGWAAGNLPPGAGGTVGAATNQVVAKAAAKAPAKKAGPSQTAGDRTLGIDEFMRAIARVESGGRYDAVNKSSGARGKYQIMPANWAGWASKYLGNANAAQSPANQEKVAKGKMLDLYKWLGDWRAVAHWWLTGGSDKAGHNNPSSWSSSSRSYVNKVFAGLGMSPTQVSGSSFRAAGTSGGGVAPSAPTAGYSGGVSTGGAGTGVRTTPAPAGTSTVARSPFKIPKGLDAAQFERFYDRFLDAYESGEENFVDYSTGRAISYFIPADLNARSELVGYLDEVRIGAYAAKARAYAGSPSEQVAMTAYSDAIKKAGENQMLILDTNAKPPPSYVPSMGRPMTGRSPLAINPIAEGLKLKKFAESALAIASKNAKAALARGDIEAAYNFIQHGLNLAAENDAQLTNYYRNANAVIRSLKQTGAKVPEMVQSDLQELAGALDFDLGEGGASPGYSSALQSLEDTANEIEKWVQFDDNDEPKRLRGATDDDDQFVLKPGVDVFLKANGQIEYKQTAFTGWSRDGSSQRDRGDYVSVTVKVGSSVKQVKAAWESAVIGFIAGTKVPIQGKLITGMVEGKEYAWVENPFAPGKWIRTDPNRPLQIKAPAGMSVMANPDGSASIEFTTGGGPGGGVGAKRFRMMFDDEDGTYHLYEPPGLFGGTEWKDLGSASSDTEIGALLTESWSVDGSSFKGDDATFFNSTGPWIGFTAAERDNAVRNTQSPRRLPNIPGHTIYGPGSSGWGPNAPARFGGLSPDERDERKRATVAPRSVGGGYGQMGEQRGWNVTPRAADADDRATSRPLPPITAPRAIGGGYGKMGQPSGIGQSPDAAERAAAAKKPAAKKPLQKQNVAARKTTPPKAIAKPAVKAQRTPARRKPAAKRPVVRKPAPKPTPKVGAQRRFQEFG